MQPNIYLRLAQHRLFWRIRAWAQRLQFEILSRIFSAKYAVQEERAKASVLLKFVWATARQLFAALGIAVVLQILELVLLNYLIARWPIPKPDVYTSWLGALAQIGGVFIALYFTAVTAAAAAIYAQVPNNVRDLLAQERWGNVYIRYLTFATFLPVCLIALHLLGFEPLRLAVPFLTFFSGIGIIAFTKLGQRAFNLFDPTRLSYALFAELTMWIREVGPGGFRWLDPSFQKHAHRRAAATIDTLEAVSLVSGSKPSPKGRALLELMGSLLNFLSQYQSQKLRIPTRSLWFAERYQHGDWYLTEDSKVQFAHHAGITLYPETVTELDWVEDDVERIVLRFFESSVLARRLDDHLELLNRIGGYIAALAAGGNTRRAGSLIANFQATFQKARLAEEAPENPPVESMEDIAIGELLSFLHLQALTNYAGELKKRGVEETKKRLQKIRWQRPESIYEGFFRANELRQLEWHLPRVELEERVEGQTVTPLWYTQALVLKSQAESLLQNVTALVADGNKAFRSWAGQLTKQGRVWQSAAVLSRHLEYLRKLETHCLVLFKTHYEAMQTAKRLSDLKWPDIKPEEWYEQVRKSHRALDESMANHIILLQGSKRPAGVPDYFGQFVHTIGESLFGDILSHRLNEAKAVFPAYFSGSLALFDELKPPVGDFDVWVEQRIQVAAAPVLDVMELCGYSLLFAELHGKKEIWTVVRTLWDAFIGSRPEALKFLAAIANVGELQMQIPHRSLIRTNWAIQVERELAKVPRRHAIVGRGASPGIYAREIIGHPSALIRYAAKRNFLHGKDIFVALYLAKLPGAEGLKWGYMRPEIDESLQYEEERNAQDDAEHDD